MYFRGGECTLFGAKKKVTRSMFKVKKSLPLFKI
jgi:hypothetical protein